MTKSKGKGGKNKRKCKKSNYESNDILYFKDVNQDYARIISRKGGPIVTLELSEDRKECLGVIRGKMRRKVWINDNDIVLVGLREFQKDKVDIISKYNDKQIRKLIALGELTYEFVNDKKNNFNETDIDDIGFQFGSIDDIFLFDKS